MEIPSTYKKEMRSFLLVQKQLHLLQQIIYHIDNLARAPIETCDWSQNEKKFYDEQFIL